MVEPALLYLLAKRDSTHGYDLIQQANELGICETTVDAGAVYRALRQLEDAGLVESTWDTTGGGPARRDYAVTDAGRAHLKAWADVLRRRAEMMSRFAQLCDEID
ncbi:MAG: helix-turn-helix transcriptional regulator [Armatimonadetes bacterium]|nr:helix-turn-helix transcriptional regulator [Armatimonadota bacterium]